MLALPANGVSLDDKIAAVKLMLARGMPIEEMNAVRKHLSAVKGGWLAARARSCCTLAISDVIGPAEDDLSVIGSGPGVADASSFADAVRALRARGLWDAIPASVREHLALGVEGKRPETPKPGDRRLAHARGFVIGSRRDAMNGARAAATRLGYRAVAFAEPTLGEAKLAGPSVVRRARRIFEEGDRLCVISSGETTVHVTGPGRGGRNQELALAALPALAEEGRSAVLISIGSDGVDGPTDGAGAIADERSLSRASALGLPRVDDVLRGTNVGDLQVILVN
jgi:hydroxypyruvate reductase